MPTTGNSGREMVRLPVVAPPMGLPAPHAAGEPPAAGVKRDYAGLLEYWQMIRRHKLAVCVATFLGMAVGLLVTFPQPRIYPARTTVEIQGLNEEFLNMRNVNPTVTPTSTYYPDFDIQTQVRILQSKSIVRRATKKLDEQKDIAILQPADRLSAWRKALHIAPPAGEALWSEAVGAASGSLKVRSTGTNRIVEISCESTNPQVAANFLNTLTNEYIEENLEARWKTTEHTGEWLTKQLQDLKVKLSRAEDELQTYARASGILITQEKNNVDESRLTDLQKELADAHSDRITKQSKYEMASVAPDAISEILDDATLQESHRSLNDLRRQVAALRVKLAATNPEVQKVQAQITMIEASLQKQRNNVLTRIQNEYESAKRREDLLAKGYATQARRVSDESNKAAHYTLLRREVDSNRALYETMLQKLKEASIASALRASNIRIVDPAEPSGGPSKPDVPRSVTVGLLTGLLIGISFAVLRERADRTLQDPGDVTFYIKLPELGVIPVGDLQTPQSEKRLAASKHAKFLKGPFKTNGNGHGGKGAIVNGNGTGDDTESEPVVVDVQPAGLSRLEMATWHRRSSLVAESFRTTLTSILFSGQHGTRPRVLVLTSASPKEGKTTVTSNLAIAMAEINRKVLLIDADMRRPRLHNVFSVDNSRGLSDLLTESEPLTSANFESAIRETVVPRLYVMPSGDSRHGVSSLLHSARLAEVVQLARAEFDMVVIDTPPMVNISDARILAHYADGLILMVRSGVTTRDAALLAKQRFMDDGINVLGTILNGWNPNTPGYGYYRYYYAGYYHYYGNRENERQ
jgi:succinoglycan biosynthesis transport protein ExoP